MGLPDGYVSFGYKDVAPTGLHDGYVSFGYKDVAPTGLHDGCVSFGYKDVAPTGLHDGCVTLCSATKMLPRWGLLIVAFFLVIKMFPLRGLSHCSIRKQYKFNKSLSGSP